MMRQGWLKKTVVPVVLVSISLQLLSCGTLFHPERKGQTGGRIDPGIAILDGLGLLLFLLPGVIAFAVDFSNGTIYLPGSRRASLDEQSGEQQLIAITLEDQELSERNIELALREELGRAVDITAPEVRVIRLDLLKSAGTIVPAK